MSGDAIGFVFAGGKGTRLRPLTLAVPKPLLPVGTRAILEIILHWLAREGIRRIFVSVGYRGYLVRAYLREIDLGGVEVTMVEEDVPLGTAGPLSLLPPGDEPVFVMNGDVLCRAPVSKALVAHERSGADLTMLVQDHPVPLPYGLVDSVDGAVTGIREKPVVRFRVATGMYVVSRSALAFLEPGVRCDMPDLITGLISEKRQVRQFEFDEFWTDVADLADYEKVNLEAEQWEDL